MPFDGLIHEWLRENRLILLIVSISPVSDNINEDVFIELLPVSHGNLHALVKDIRHVSVDMNHWSVDSFSHLSAVKR